MTVHIRLRHELLGGHRHVDVFAGRDPDHLAKSGSLVFREDEHDNEWDAFELALFTASCAGRDDSALESVRGEDGRLRAGPIKYHAHGDGDNCRLTFDSIERVPA